MPWKKRVNGSSSTAFKEICSQTISTAKNRKQDTVLYLRATRSVVRAFTVFEGNPFGKESWSKR